MLVYVDDSGDGGQKFEANSSSHLVMAACIFADPSQMALLSEGVDKARAASGHRREFKFNKTSNKVKDKFFGNTWHVRFNVRAISIEKRFLHSEKLRTDGSALKAYAIHRLLGNSFGNIHDAKVFIDGQDTGAFGIPDHAYLVNQVNRRSPGAIREVRFADSKESTGIQNADMIAGAIHRAVRKDHRTNTKWFEMIRPRTAFPLGTVWEFCKKEREAWQIQQVSNPPKIVDPTP